MGRSTFCVSNGIAEVRRNLPEVFTISDVLAQKEFLLSTQPAIRGALAAGKGLHSSVCVTVVSCLLGFDFCT